MGCLGLEGKITLTWVLKEASYWGVNWSQMGQNKAHSRALLHISCFGENVNVDVLGRNAVAFLRNIPPQFMYEAT